MKIFKILLLAVVVCSCGHNEDGKVNKDIIEDKLENLQTDHAMVGDIIDLSEFKLKSNNGKVIEKDKLILLDFWATWCGPCIASFPHLEAVQRKYKNQLQILAISVQDESIVKPFLEKKTFELPFFTNVDEKLYDALAITELPTTVLLSERGEFLWIGNSQRIEEVLDKVVNSEDLKVHKSDYINYKPYYEKIRNNNIDLENEGELLYKYKIKEAYDYDAFMATNAFKLYDQPANIQFRSTQVSDVVASLMEIDYSRFQNSRSSLDSIIIDVEVKSKDSKLTNDVAVKRILEDLQNIYDFTISTKKEQLDVLKLVVVDSKKLTSFIESTEGGGFAKSNEDTYEITRLNLKSIASYLENKVDANYLVYEGNDENKYSFVLDKFNSIEELKLKLTDLGLGLIIGKSQIRIVKVK